MNIAIVNCFDTYEHRVDLLYAYFKANENNVRVYTSDFRHIEKNREPKKRKTLFTFTLLDIRRISPRKE